MAQGSKAKYTPKQKRTANHIEKGYEKKGSGKKKAKKIAWATVNKESVKAGTNRKKKGPTAKKVTKKKAPSSDRSLAAKKAWVTRRKNQKKAKKV